MKTPLTVITGYLGSGKTTLLRHILEKTDKRLAIVMNEFGDIAIDAKIIKGKNVNIAELEGGCVCCSLTGEFEYAVREILEKVKPEWIILETTGTAEPDAIVLNIEELPELRLDAVITIADADALTRFPQLGHIGRVQLEMADILLINKKDLITKEQLEEVEKEVKKSNPKAVIVITEHCNVPLNLLFGIGAGKKAIPRKTRHEKGIEHFSFTTENILDKKKFESFLQTLPKEMYRAKGFVRFKEGTFLFNFVAGRSSLEKFPSKRTELVFLGAHAEKHKNSIIRKLKSCSSL